MRIDPPTRAGAASAPTSHFPRALALAAVVAAHVLLIGALLHVTTLRGIRTSDSVRPVVLWLPPLQSAAAIQTAAPSLPATRAVRKDPERAQPAQRARAPERSRPAQQPPAQAATAPRVDIELPPPAPAIARRSLTFSPERAVATSAITVPTAIANPMQRYWFMHNAYAIAQALAAHTPGTCRVRMAQTRILDGDCDSPDLAAALRDLPESSQQALVAGLAGGLAQEIMLVALPQRVDVVLR